MTLFPFLFPSLLCLLACAFLRIRLRKKLSAPYPPGPPPNPIIGNARDIPFNQYPWLKYFEWSKKLQSDIVHMSVMNTHIIVLHKYEDMIALLEKRSGIYSDRPTIPTLELMGTSPTTPALPYGDRWRWHRRIFQESLRKDQMPSFHYIHTRTVHLFLKELLDDPENFVEHCKWLATSSTLEMVYGYKLSPLNKDDPIIQASEFVAAEAGKLLLPGKTLINVIPFLGRIPPWVPGASSQRLAAAVKQQAIRYKTESFEYVEHNLVTFVQ